MALKKVKIGDLLVEKNKISQEQLDQALKLQSAQGGKVGDILIQQGYIKEKELLKTLAEQLKMPFVDIEHYDINKEASQRIPEKLSRRYKMLPIDFKDYRFLIAMADPTDVQALDELNRLFMEPIQPVVVSQPALIRILDLVFRRTKEIASFADELGEELGVQEAVTKAAEYEELGGESAPVAKLLDSIFTDAIQVGASDIHIQPEKNKFLIRQRVDGVLQESELKGKEIVNALVLRIKLMAKLNISEKRVPQDGRLHLSIRDHELDVRVSTMPTKHGESVVMRLLDQSKGLITLENVGFRDDILERIEYLITRPNGLILVTGPTGSGKTTSLYAILHRLNKAEKKIITIEDPIEYTLPRITQVQVNPVIDLTFARVLRSTLRQDPDIVMIGEMRDTETASIGLRAAMTGHLVLSTLHTNDAISSSIRLIDMGAEGYLVASSLKAVFAQRLIRRLCESCKDKAVLSNADKVWLKNLMGEIDPNWQFMQGIGCSSCNKTGYQGRMAIHELLEINTELAECLKKADNAAFARAAMRQKTYKPLTQAAFEIALEGSTSLQEVFKVASELEEVHKLATVDDKSSSANVSTKKMPKQGKDFSQINF